MRQQIKPFMSNANRPANPNPMPRDQSIWGRLDADIIAQGLKEPLDTDQATATGGDGRAQA
ncbi:hypothetical protein [Ensifer sp. ENS02]|uniref:hypothetical protein n=1 Tax=Ensifer sp. ENS02 TaxID=2769290 RepID=UPI001FEE4D4C|nr:hypothetical protein [Ensifer sp. ENS02]